MPSVSNGRAAPKVAAILVVNDGRAWLPSVLRSLQAQDYPNLRLVAVDNGSRDGSRALLEQAIGPADLIPVNRSTGFGRAVRAAAQHEAAADADYLLLVHDDLALSPDAVRLLVEALEGDASLAAVGPKLREWATEPLLQEVGMTVDRFGRAESQVERGELDQGHRDTRRETLYVSTAGMLVRAEAFRELEGFDPRFTALRDDLDLCWRAWLQGWRVEVVPDAVAYHVAAGSRGLRRLWRDRRWQARFLSERHALASLIKNYSLPRLAWILPLTALLGTAKLIGFAMTRRFADVGATMRAYAWNVIALPDTLRRRRAVQRSRQRSDAELGHLFATGLPRVRDYADAMREWLAGSDAPSILGEHEAPRPAAQRGKLRRLARERPSVIVGALLGLVYLAGVLPLLGPGQLIGGSVLPWPDSAGAFWQTYASPVAGDPMSTGVSASPVQVVLGATSLAVLGNAWLAQRIVVLGLLPLAWLAALRAGRLVTSRRGPRVVGATLYVLSPVVLGTLSEGRVGELAVAALLPAIVLLTARASSARAARGQAWRATAWLTLAAATAIAAAPGLWVVVVPVLLVGLAVALWPDPASRGRPLLRMITVAGGTMALLAPWIWDLARSPGGVLEAAPASPLPAWRALALAPLTMPGLDGTAGYLAAALTVVVLLLAMTLGLRLRPLPVTALVAVLVLSATVAWSAERVGAEWVWAPALLLPGAAALAGLGIVATRTVGTALRAYTFGVPQLTVLVAAVPLAAGLLVSAWSVASGPWEVFQRDVELVPPYVAAEADRVGAYRILLLEASANELRWGMTEAQGPSMEAFGTGRSQVLEGAVDRALVGILAGDLESGTRLGLANVRYLVLSDDSPDLRAALLDQPDLEPMVAGGGRIFLVRAWLPRVAQLPAERAEDLLEGRAAGDLQPYQDTGLERVGAATYVGRAGADGEVLLVSEEPGTMRASARGGALERLPVADGLPVDAFAGSQLAPGAQITVEPTATTARRAWLVFQALVFLGLVSLLLRPPGSAETDRRRHEAQSGLVVPPVVAEDAEPPLETRLAAGAPAGAPEEQRS